jgi:hypothetical protein
VGNTRYRPQRRSRNCGWCWREYQQTRFDQRYCSGRCRVAALRARRRTGPFEYRFAPIAAAVPDEAALERLLLAAAGRWRTPDRTIAHATHVLADWLSDDGDEHTPQNVIDSANDLAHKLRRQRPLIAYPIGTHPDDGDPFDGRFLPSGNSNARRWVYRAWVAGLDDEQQHLVADALVASASDRDFELLRENARSRDV